MLFCSALNSHAVSSSWATWKTKFVLVSSFIYAVKMLLDPKYRIRTVGMVLKSLGVI